MRINKGFVDDTVIWESILTLCYKDRNSYFECHQQSVTTSKMKPSIPSSNATCSTSSDRITSYEHIVAEGRNCSTNFCFRAIPLTICLCPLPLTGTSAQHHSSETLLRDAPSDRSKRIHRNIPGNRTFLFFLTSPLATRNHYVRSIVNVSQFSEDRTRKIIYENVTSFLITILLDDTLILQYENLQHGISDK